MTVPASIRLTLFQAEEIEQDAISLDFPFELAWKGRAPWLIMAPENVSAFLIAVLDRRDIYNELRLGGDTAYISCWRSLNLLAGKVSELMSPRDIPGEVQCRL